MLDITLLSSHYDVRPLTEDKVDEILRIYQSNPQFFAYCVQRPTREQVLSDMCVTPPGTKGSNKHFVGFFTGNELVAIMDLVDGYPTPETAYLGLFMVDARFQGKHVGSSIIDELKRFLHCAGKKTVRLAINKGNPQATHFWEKHGFVVVREVENDGWPLLEAECGILNKLCIPTERGTMSSVDRPTFPARAVITGGMPYGNKNLHFGHIGGVFVPADFFARFLRDRIGAENVIFVSGTDCYGSPIMEGYRKKVAEGYEGSITDYVKANHDLQKEALDAYGISLDIFAGSGLEPANPFHAKLSHDLITRLYERGYLKKMSTRQFYDVQAGQFLNGRQVVGRCPVQGCKSEKAYADECDLGHQFDPEELISPISQLTGTTPELRPVDNWYFDLPAFRDELEALTDEWDDDPQVRAIVTQTVREYLGDPVIFVQNKFRAEFDALEDRLPAHRIVESVGNQSSFQVVFSDWRDRDAAREVLESAGVRFRTGKTLLPFRLTGNIDWGVPAPDLEDVTGLTVWVWPESLWAPISFTQTVLATAPEGRYSSTDWHDWWCADDARVYQFIGQDNIYFYCIAQPAMWSALDWGLFQDTPIANYHILFMNKKASSSGKIKPPMAAELLDFYNAEQLRAHWLSLGLDQKAVSFSPKAFDTSVSHKNKKTGEDVLVKDDPRVVDPALKESAFLTNIFNRLARSCLYGAANACDGHLPVSEPHAEVVEACNQATLAYERCAHGFDAHGALAVVEDFARAENKRWGDASKAAKGDDAAYDQALADAFCALRTTCLLMHPAVPSGCELIADYLNFGNDLFFSWEHAFEGPRELAATLGETCEQHRLKELPPRFDFFKKREGQK